MKRIVGAGLVLVIVLALLTGCDHGSQSQQREPQSQPSDLQPQTSTGLGENLWHWNVNFNAYATVTVTNNLLTQVTIDPDQGYYHTGAGAFPMWTMQVRDDFVKEFIGLSVKEVIELNVLPAQDVTDHYDGGSIEGAVDAVTGATASSVTIALAIQDAVSKIANMNE